MNVRVTKKFTFDLAHALYGYDGPCKNIHGHTYHLYVTVIGSVINDETNVHNGMVMDFSELKSIVKTHVVDVFDHSLVLNQSSFKNSLETLKENYEKVLFVPFQPSCENLMLEFKRRIGPFLQGNKQLIYLKLEETPTSYSEWYLTDN